MAEISTKNLPKHTLIYAFGNIVSRSVGLILIPFYLSYLPKDQYGVLEIVDVTVALLAQLLGFNIGGAMVRFYFESDDPLRRRRLIATTQVFFALFVGLITLGLALLAPLIAPALFGSDEFRVHFRLTMAILFFSAAAEPGVQLMRAQQRSVMFVLLAFSKMLIEIGLKVYLIAWMGWGVLGAISGSVFAWIYTTVLVVVWVFGQSGLRVSWSDLKRLAAYSFPLIFSGLSGFVLHSADRYMIRWLGEAGGTGNLGEVGIYGLAYKFGYLVNFALLDPFLLIWFPYIFSLRSRDKQQRRVAEVASYMSALFVWGSLALALAAPGVVRIVAKDREYWAADGPIPVIVLGYLFWCLYQLFHTGIFIEKRTRLLPPVVMAAAAVNVALNYLLVPRYGIMGAAWATVVAFGVLAALAYWRTSTVFRVRYEWRRLAGPALLGLALYATGRMAGAAVPAGRVWLGLLLDLGLVVLYPLILWRVGFVRAAEWEKVKDGLMALRRQWAGRRGKG